MAPRFSEEMRLILQSVTAEAGRLGHEYIGTEHLLLALTKERPSVAADILERIGVAVERIRREVERVVEVGRVVAARQNLRGNTTEQLIYTPYGRSAIEHAVGAMGVFGDDFVRSEHLLIGLLRETAGTAFEVLDRLGVKVDAVLVAIPEEREKSSQIPKWLAWNGGTVAAIARSIAEERNWDGLPVLADALEEAGCADQDILDHLRQMETHPCRTELQSGCWVLHRLLAAEAVHESADESPRKRWWQFWK
jgi:ATP-dependent Clp protease ATP-binding subunit ClpA